MWLLLLEAGAAFFVLVFIVWWTMYSGREPEQEQEQEHEQENEQEQLKARSKADAGTLESPPER